MFEPIVASPTYCDDRVRLCVFIPVVSPDYSKFEKLRGLQKTISSRLYAGASHPVRILCLVAWEP